MSARLVLAYRQGREVDGWICVTCRARFAHHGKPRRALARLLLHKILHRHPWTEDVGSTYVLTFPDGRVVFRADR